MADPTFDTSDVTDRIKYLLEQNRGTLGLNYIRYGSEEDIPQVPAAIIEPGELARTYIGAGQPRTENEFEITILVYHTGFGGEENIQQTVDPITEKIANVINADALSAHSGGTQFNGLLIDGLCTRIQYGYSGKDDTRMRANRITFSGRSRTGVVST